MANKKKTSKILKAKKRAKRRYRNSESERLDMRKGGRVALQRGGRRKPKPSKAQVLQEFDPNIQPTQPETRVKQPSISKFNVTDEQKIQSRRRGIPEEQRGLLYDPKRPQPLPSTPLPSVRQVPIPEGKPIGTLNPNLRREPPIMDTKQEERIRKAQEEASRRGGEQELLRGMQSLTGASQVGGQHTFVKPLQVIGADGKLRVVQPENIPAYNEGNTELAELPPSKVPFGPGHPLFDPRGTSPIGPPPRLPSGCPSPEEHIQLANNDWILAGELKVGDEVITSKEPQKVTFAKTIEDSPRREVLFTEGDSIVTSPSHPYFVKDKGFVDVEDLKEGDAVGDLIVSEVKPFSDGPVIHISVDKAQTYMLRGGTEENPVPALSHNKSLPAPEDRIGWPPGEQVLPPPRPPTMPGPGTSPPSIGPISTPTMPPQPIRPMPVMPRPIPPEMPQPIPREMPQRVMDPMPMPRPVMPQPMPPKMPPPGLFPMPDIQPMLPTPPRGIRAIPRPGARRRPRGGGGGP